MKSKQTLFRTHRGLFHWTKEHHAPFVRSIYFELLGLFQRRFPRQNWERDLLQARKDISHAKKWGLLNIQSQKLSLKVEGRPITVWPSSAGWYLLFPDYLLSAYPTLPAGQARLLDYSFGTTLNPAYNYPSLYWHLPKQVYDWFELEYGPRNPEEVKQERYQNFLVQRQQRIDYFCRRFKVNPARFELYRSRDDLAQIVELS